MFALQDGVAQNRVVGGLLGKVLREVPFGDTVSTLERVVSKAVVAFAAGPSLAKKTKLVKAMRALMGVTVDDKSFEGLLREFMKWDGGLKNGEGMKATRAALSKQVNLSAHSDIFLAQFTPQTFSSCVMPTIVTKPSLCRRLTNCR